MSAYILQDKGMNRTGPACRGRSMPPQERERRMCESLLGFHRHSLPVPVPLKLIIWIKVKRGEL